MSLYISLLLYVGESESMCLLILVALAILVLFLVRSPSEKFTKMCHLPNPQKTGMERALWGPLRTLPPANENVVSQYETMHSLPWCSPPLDHSTESSPRGEYGLCNDRRPPGRVDVPYEKNKI